MTGPRYSDEEVALILRKAGELQVEGIPRGDGLELTEIEEIAREAGIDSALVRRAASEISRSVPGPMERLLGGPIRYQAHVTHDGVPSPEELQEYVAAIRAALDNPGTASEVLGALEWKTEGELGWVAVTIGTRDGATRIDVMADRRPAAALTIAVSVGGGLFVAAITGAVTEPFAPAVGVGLLLTGAAGGVAFARMLWRTQTARFRARLGTLLEALRKDSPEE